jgi:rhamnopyranosyl-N-acetylglucosaminyl-diphospho-decaprenol beta-1,3/1,4-galactofuranosyltransferase
MKVAAVIVTRNRYALLGRCLESLHAQTRRLDRILIIDNGSTDDTRHYQPKAGESVIRQANTGGAGGFKRGLLEFLNTDCEAAWLMDDDGMAAPQALEQLLTPECSEFQWRNALVLNEANHQELSFSVYKNGRWTSQREDLESSEVLAGTANPFNGTLVTRRLVDKIGLPVAAFFIKGDEREYQDRAIRHGFSVSTVCSSVFYHPRNRELRIGEVDAARVWTYFYEVRNAGARGNADGSYAYNGGRAREAAAEYLRDLFGAWRASQIGLGSVLVRAFVVCRGAVAATLNLPRYLRLQDREVVLR